MKIKVLQQGLTFDARVHNEGEECETRNAGVMAMALGLYLLKSDRKTIEGFFVRGDRRGAELLSEATPDERAEAEAYTQAAAEPWTGVHFRRTPAPVMLDQGSIDALAHAVAGAIPAKVARA